jgi:hypothetical protein
MLIGYDEQSKDYQVFNPNNRNVEITKDVKFNKGSFGLRQHIEKQNHKGLNVSQFIFQEIQGESSTNKFQELGGTKLNTILSPKTSGSNENIKQKSKEPISDDDTNTRT